jgi:hypothetical protein
MWLVLPENQYLFSFLAHLAQHVEDYVRVGDEKQSH